MLLSQIQSVIQGDRQFPLLLAPIELEEALFLICPVLLLIAVLVVIYYLKLI